MAIRLLSTCTYEMENFTILRTRKTVFNFVKKESYTRQMGLGFDLISFSACTIRTKLWAKFATLHILKLNFQKDGAESKSISQAGQIPLTTLSTTIIIQRVESTRWSNFGLYQSQHGSRDKESNCAVDPTFDIAPDYVWNIAQRRKMPLFLFCSYFLFFIDHTYFS